MKTNEPSILSNQGDEFLNLQNQIITNTFNENSNNNDLLESFGNQNNPYNESKKVLRNTKINKSKNNQLNDEYNNIVKQFITLNNDLMNQSKSYNKLEKSKYLGKNLQIGQGIFYITNEGIAKWYPNSNSMGKLGCPSSNQLDNTFQSNEWDNSWKSPGAILPTNPAFITGTPMPGSGNGQTCGYAGKNVYVNEIIQGGGNPQYQDTYIENGSLTFSGGSPPESITIQNNDFSAPQIKGNSYEYIYGASWNTTIPGWYFNAVLINNSSAWGYVMPYPSGDQACCLQGTQQIYTWIDQLQAGVDYTVSFYATGRPNYPINDIKVFLWNKTQNNYPEIGTISSPSDSKWTLYSLNFTVPDTGGYSLYFQGTISSPGNSAISLINITTGSSAGNNYTWKECKSQAINSGNQYFAIQNGNSSTGLGYCGVTNDFVSASQSGISYKTESTTALWASNTVGEGSYAQLSSIGTLEVYNSSNQVVWSSPGPTNSSYWGCYQDNSTRAIPNYMGNSSISDCKTTANPSSSSENAVYGVQDAGGSTTGQCFINESDPSNFTQAREYGMATNCTQDSNSQMIGSGWSNAVYGTQPGFTCFIDIQTDGNLVIYRGQSASDNQGVIWATGTNGKAQDANPNWKMSNAKYNSNIISNGFNGNEDSSNGFMLYSNDFIYSSNGNLMLIMQSDGNLVLYTSKVVENNFKNSNNHTLGGVNANALYKLNIEGGSGNKDLVGKMAYINSNGESLLYSDNDLELSNKYTKINNTNWAVNSNLGNVIDNSTIPDCKKSCNENDQCGGFVFGGTGCLLKSTDADPTDLSVNTGARTFIRNKKLINVPNGVPNNVTNIGSNLFSNIPSGGNINMTGNYGMAKFNSVKQNELSQLEQRLNSVAKKLGKNTSQLETDINQVIGRSYKNNPQAKAKFKDFLKTKRKIIELSTENPTLSRFVDTSDINNLKDNYDYLFWSILAIGSIVAVMSLSKNKV